MRIFGLDASRPFAEKVADALGRPLDSHEERAFEDGEHKARPLVGVRGQDVFVIQGLDGQAGHSANDKLVRLLFFLATLKEHGAGRVTAVAPYLAYSRKDRQTKPRDPVTTRYVAALFEAVGTDRVVTLDVHNLAAFQNAFRCETVHLDTRRLFAQRVAALAGVAPLVVASPDPGGVKRAQLFQETVEATLGRPIGGAFMEKRRSGGVVSGERLVGEVRGAVVLLVDDLISTAGTLARAADACRAAGAHAVYAFAAHGLFSGQAAATLADSVLERTFVTDTVLPSRLADGGERARVEVISAAPLFADAIRRLHTGGSITGLLEGDG